MATTTTINSTFNMAHFRDLPDEVISIIISYLPIEDLKKLFDVPYLGKFAKREAHSTVVINEPNSSYSKAAYYANEILYTKSTTDYLKCLESDPNLAPKRIIFKNPFDALALAKTSPSAMANVKAELHFAKTHLSATKSGLYVHEYLKMPFCVDSIHTVYGDNFDDYLCLSLTRNVKSLTVMATNPIDLKCISQMFFSRLTFLKVNQNLDSEELHLLPRNLKVFLGGILKTSLLQMKLEFPQTLEKLYLEVDCRDGDRDLECEFDIAHLINLNDARIEPPSDHSGLITRTSMPGFWKLPKNLKKLCISHNRMISGKLETVCTSLMELKIEERYAGDNKDFIQGLSIPESVKVLSIPYFFLSYKKELVSLDYLKDHPQLRNRVKFPDGLIKLTITGHNDIRRTMVLDFHVNKLPKLEELSLLFPGHVNVFGKFPKTIKKFIQHNYPCFSIGTMMSVKTFDMNKFKEMESLTEIKLENVYKRNKCHYKVPASLRRFSYLESELTRVHIDAPKLEYLNLSKNKFYHPDNVKFVLPDNLKQLILQKCSIFEFSPALPENLHYLDLTDNKLRAIENLPENLKELKCESNRLGESDSVSTFPTGLVRLNLRNNRDLTGKHIETLNLSQCHNLRFLDLSGAKLEKLNLDSLPGGLQKINLSSCQLSSLDGSFLRFQALEELYLSLNELGGYFHNAFKNYGSLFGSNIKIVNVSGNRLQPIEVKLLQNELSTKPSFKNLIFDRDLAKQPVPRSNPPDEVVNLGTPLDSNRPKKQRKLNQ